MSFLISFLNVFAQEKSLDRALKLYLRNTVPTITVDDLANSKKDVLLLDTREPNEYEVSHLKGARNIGYTNFDLNSLSKIPKNQEIVVYCSIGVRSEKIGEKLQKAGFTNVRNLKGSIFEWVNHGYPIVDSEGRPTHKIHTYNKKWSNYVRKGEKVY